MFYLLIFISKLTVFFQIIVLTILLFFNYVFKIFLRPMAPQCFVHLLNTYIL